MHRISPSLQPSTCLRCAYRATLATGRVRRPSRPLRTNARSRPSRALPSGSRPWAQSSDEQSQEKPEKKLTLSEALRDTKNDDNSLLSPVHVPEDPDGVLNEKHPAANILTNSGLVVQRQLELMNVMIGFEQANKYVILDPQGNHIGFMAEQDSSMGRTMARQMLSTHRSFTTHVFNKHEQEVLRFHRPFSWVSSRIGVYDPVEVGTGSQSKSRDMITSTPGSLSTQVDSIPSQISHLALSEMRIIGEAQQQWAPLRRKYNLFLSHQSPKLETSINTPEISSGELSLSSSQQLQVSEASQGSSSAEHSQFAYVDEPFLSWDFSLISADGGKIGSVNRNWGGIGRELFTDTGVYALRMDAAEPSSGQRPSSGQNNVPTPYEKRVGMTLDQRAVMLATAVSIDFDYFSRHSGAGGGVGWMPLWFPGIGGEGAAAGGAAEGAGAIEAAEEGSIIRGAESSGTGISEIREGAAVGAGSMAGYEALQRGTGRSGADASSSTFADEFQEDIHEPGNMAQDIEGMNNEFWPGTSEPNPGDRASRGGSSDEGETGSWGGNDDGGDGDFFDF
ncbi:MAG: hypothetical protein Q9172_007848 [Xanthocarpia lactea]